MKAGVPSSPSWQELPGEGPGLLVPWLVPTAAQSGGRHGNKVAVLAGGRAAASQGGGGCKSGEEKDGREGLTRCGPGPRCPPTGLNALGRRTTCPAPVCAGVSANNPVKGETCSRPPKHIYFWLLCEEPGGPRQSHSAGGAASATGILLPSQAGTRAPPAPAPQPPGQGD